MDFDTFDKRMRVFETAHDYCVLPETYMIARLDGRSFTRLTKEVCRFESPYDERFRDHITNTVMHLMQCGFNIIYGYTQSDEISLLFHLNEQAFGRKLRKYNSILAGEASARFSLLVEEIATFDCRISQLPKMELVVDYFQWRQADAHRNALNAHCYWLLRKQGLSGRQATNTLIGMPVSAKNELLFQDGINFNDLPNWQKRGVGLYWATYLKSGHNPITGQEVLAQRRRIKCDLELPMKDEYARFISEMINRAATSDKGE